MKVIDESNNSMNLSKTKVIYFINLKQVLIVK
jgi:hypothetical protein